LDEQPTPKKDMNGRKALQKYMGAPSLGSSSLKSLDLCAFCECERERILYIDAQVSNGAFDFGVSH
jgi:hypothetical protein